MVRVKVRNNHYQSKTHRNNAARTGPMSLRSTNISTEDFFKNVKHYLKNIFKFKYFPITNNNENNNSIILIKTITTNLFGFLLELLDGSLIYTTTFVDKMSSCCRLAGVDMPNNNNVKMGLFFRSSWRHG